jgi:hypothetical protein
MIQGNSRFVAVQVNIPFQYQWTWSTEPGRQMPQFRSLDMILQEERASDYQYTSPQKLERVELAMTVAPVHVRRLRGGSPVDVQVTEGIDAYYRTQLSPAGDDEE